MFKRHLFLGIDRSTRGYAEFQPGATLRTTMRQLEGEKPKRV